MGHSPVWVVRRGRDNAYFVSAERQPFSHFAGVFADARELGGKVDAVEEDLHAKDGPRSFASLTLATEPGNVERGWKGKRVCLKPGHVQDSEAFTLYEVP